MRKVFLSSTSKDLAEYRRAVIEAIDGLDGYKCFRMENFGARDEDADTFCRELVEQCDLFVCILGHLYGSSPPNSDLSYTEREFEAAAEKSRLVFVAPESFALPNNLRESDDKFQRQQTFRKKASVDCIRATFDSPEKLAIEVVKAIANWEREENHYQVLLSTTRGLTPIPPQPCFPHTYPIQRNFTGRIRERRMLTEWLTNSDKPVFAFIAIGGMGKSALTWAWVQRDVLGDSLPAAAPDSLIDAAQCCVSEDQRPKGVFWWSFYEREASFAAFVKQALVYASGGLVKLDDVPSTAEQVRTLVTLLREQKLLLVLDGFERELRAYASLSAAYQGDIVTEDIQGDYRAATSPHTAWFLQAICVQALQSRVLLTSRLLPRELDELAGCERQDLDSLHPADAVSFFQAHGVRGTRVEIQEACYPYGYHPLSLRLLVGVILKDKRTPGDIQVAKKHAIVPELKGKEQHHILQVAYEDLSEEKRALLSQIAAFRFSMSFGSLLILNPYEEEDKFDIALDELIERGLFVHDRMIGQFDMHPIVRQYSYDRLVHKEGIHVRLRDYFASVPLPEKQRIKNVKDLEYVIELYHHTVRSIAYDKALELYRERIGDLLYYRFGEYQAIIELLRPLLPEAHPPRLTLSKDVNHLYVLREIGRCQARCGHPRQATILFEKHNSLLSRDDSDYRNNLANGFLNLGYNYLKLGELMKARQNIVQSINPSHIADIDNSLIWIKDEGKINIEALRYRDTLRGKSHRRELGKILHPTEIQNEDLNIGFSSDTDLLSSDYGVASTISYNDDKVTHYTSGPELERSRCLAEAYLCLIEYFLYIGEDKAVDTIFSSVILNYEAGKYKLGYCITEIYIAWHAMMTKRLDFALISARQAHSFWLNDSGKEYPPENHFVNLLWILGNILILTGNKDEPPSQSFLLEAEIYLTDALTRCRRINLVEFEPDILLAWARLYQARGDTAQAHKAAQESLTIADRCEYRLKQAEIHNFLSQLAYENAQLDAALRHARQAYERAWCDGPPYCYKPALDEAEKMLQRLDSPLPQMP